MLCNWQVNTWFDVLSPLDGRKLPAADGADLGGGFCSLHLVLGYEPPAVQAVVGPALAGPSGVTSLLDAGGVVTHRVDSERPAAPAGGGPAARGGSSSPAAPGGPTTDRALERMEDTAGIGVAMRLGPRGEHVVEYVVEVSIEAKPTTIGRGYLPPARSRHGFQGFYVCPHLMRL